MILYYLMNISLKFHKDLSFRCGDICKTILTVKNHQFSMYFAYFHIFAPPKSSQMETPVSAYRLFSIPSNKQIIYVNSRRSPCSNVDILPCLLLCCRSAPGLLVVTNGMYSAVNRVTCPRVLQLKLTLVIGLSLWVVWK